MKADLSAMVASAATRKAMSRRFDLAERGWTFWERRNLNLHRVVGLMQADRRFDGPRALDAELRGALARNFKRGWWRGIAYGVVANAGSLALTPEDLKILVDARENPKGTMQWVILLAGDGSKATGVHTWIEGYLSPVYRDILQALSTRGCEIASVMKEKDGLMRVLTAVADARARAYTGQAAFPEFRDPFLTAKSRNDRSSQPGDASQKRTK